MCTVLPRKMYNKLCEKTKKHLSENKNLTVTIKASELKKDNTNMILNAIKNNIRKRGVL